MSEGGADADQPGEPSDPDQDAEPVADPEADLPLSALRERVEAEREERAGREEDDPFDDVEGEAASAVDSGELFEEVEVAEVDGEAVWDAIVEGDAEADELLGEEPRTESEPEPAVEATESPDEHVVAKREYCQRCEFFTRPPDATCSNEGTEIVELVDNDHFRVRGCPKVADDDEALSGFATDGEE